MLTAEIKATIRKELEIRQRQVQLSMSGGGYTSSELYAKQIERLVRIDAAIAWLDTLAAGEVDADGLLPCPFCGGEVRMGQDDHLFWWIDCSACGVTFEPFETAEIAVMKWNRRTPAPQPLDTPDSPGWWAFEGRYIDMDVEFRDAFKVLEINGALHRGDGIGSLYGPVIEMVGKWYRLTMPWDAPQPTQEEKKQP